VGVAWELVGLAMGQVAVKWNTMGEWRALERVRESGGRYGAQRTDRGCWKAGVLMWFSWWCAQMATYFALAGEAR
jgi:hypothetical protein